MQISVSNSDFYGEVTTAVIDHNGESINCNIALFDRTAYNNRYDLFEHLNQFWSKLTADEQNSIFNIYKEIRSAFDRVSTVDELDEILYPLVNQLVILHDLEKINFWTLFNSNINIPQEIEEDFVESETNTNTRIKTYLQKDYRDLVNMVIVFRAMIPVWGEYIYNTKNEYGTEYKEYYAFKLLSSSLLDNCHAMQKLREYVTHNIPSEKERSRATAIISGVSSEDLPEWLLGLVVIRKLSAGDLRGIDNEGHLISSAYNYIFNKLKTLESSFSGNIRAKVPEDKTNDDNKASLLEGYRARQNTSVADIVAAEVYLNTTELNNVSKVVKAICKDIDDNVVLEIFDSVKQLVGKPINSGQRTIAQWVLASAIPPDTIGMTDHLTTIKALAAACSVLWARGHYQLAALVTSVEFTINGELVMMASYGSRQRIPKDDLEQLDALYPFSRKPGGKKRVLKRVNAAVESIELVAEQLSQKDWLITIPDSLLKEKVSIFGDRRRIGVPNDIRPLLSALVLDVAKGNFNVLHKGITA